MEGLVSTGPTLPSFLCLDSRAFCQPIWVELYHHSILHNWHPHLWLWISSAITIVSLYKGKTFVKRESFVKWETFVKRETFVTREARRAAVAAVNVDREGTCRKTHCFRVGLLQHSPSTTPCSRVTRPRQTKASPSILISPLLLHPHLSVSRPENIIILGFGQTLD